VGVSKTQHCTKLKPLSFDKAVVTWKHLLGDRAVLVLIAFPFFLFHLANAPIPPVTALYPPHVGSTLSFVLRISSASLTRSSSPGVLESEMGRLREKLARDKIKVDPDAGPHMRAGF